MVKCYIIRTNRTIKTKIVSNKKDRFKFEKGIYYIINKHIVLEKRLYGFRPVLVYIEGISEPISISNVEKRKKRVYNEKTKKYEDIEDITVLIDAWSIHNLTDREMLRVLSETGLTKKDYVFILMHFITWCITIGIGVAILDKI